MIGQSCVNKDGLCRMLNSFFVGREHSPLSVWAFCLVKTRKGLENEIERLHATMDFHTRCPKDYDSPAISCIFCDSSSKPFSFFTFCCLFFEGTYDVSQRLRLLTFREFLVNFNSFKLVFFVVRHFFLNLPRSRASLTANYKR